MSSLRYYYTDNMQDQIFFLLGAALLCYSALNKCLTSFNVLFLKVHSPILSFGSVLLDTPGHNTSNGLFH